MYQPVEVHGIVIGVGVTEATESWLCSEMICNTLFECGPKATKKEEREEADRSRKNAELIADALNAFVAAKGQEMTARKTVKQSAPMPRCELLNVVRHISKANAKNAAKRDRTPGEHRVFKCEHCQGWHYTGSR